MPERPSLTDRGSGADRRRKQTHHRLPRIDLATVDSGDRGIDVFTVDLTDDVRLVGTAVDLGAHLVGGDPVDQPAPDGGIGEQVTCLLPVHTIDRRRDRERVAHTADRVDDRLDVGVCHRDLDGSDGSGPASQGRVVGRHTGIGSPIRTSTIRTSAIGGDIITIAATGGEGQRQKKREYEQAEFHGVPLLVIDSTGCVRPAVFDRVCQLSDDLEIELVPQDGVFPTTSRPTCRAQWSMGKKKNRLQSFGTGKIVVAAVERAVENRWDQAIDRADDTNGDESERVAQIERAFLRELITLGAASGGTAAMPGVGTMTAVGLTAGEVAWTATRTTDMILAVAAVHGHTDAPVEVRKSWVLALLAFDDDAADGLAKTIAEYGGTVTASRTLSLEMLERANGRVGRTLIARYGAKRSALLIGRVLPFGIGAVVGGTANHFLVRNTIRRADGFFAEIAGWKKIPPPTPNSR